MREKRGKNGEKTKREKMSEGERERDEDGREMLVGCFTVFLSLGKMKRTQK